MPTPNECLDLVKAAKASAEDPETAYVLRTRLKRSLLAAGQLAAELAGVQGPLMPEDIGRLIIKDQRSSEIVKICSSLIGKTRSLCQPSEALDSRWRSGWTAVHQDLHLLEKALLTLASSVSDKPPKQPANV